jgi:hypothetical protein
MKTTVLHKPFFHIILIVVLILISYANTFHVPFYFDDRFAIVENPIIKDLKFFIEPSKAKDFKEICRLSHVCPEL